MLQDLYNSEINVSISWHWDAGFAVSIGDGYNDNWEASTVVTTYDEAEKWLKEKAKELYPNSDFVKNIPDYGDAFNNFIGGDPEESLGKLKVR